MAETPDPIELAARALRHRDRSRRDLDDRLARGGVDDERRQEALETLERVGYVDDARFARRRAEVLARRGYGDDGIRSLLAADGVAAATVEEAVAAVPPEHERARQLLGGARDRRRAAARLVRHGFAPESLEPILGEAFAEGRSEA